jgi:hypothetical protein
MVFGYYHSHPKTLTLSQRGNSYALSPRERVGVRARKTENHYGASITCARRTYCEIFKTFISNSQKVL